LGSCVVRHIGHTFVRAHCAHEQEPAASAFDEPFAEVMGNVQMGECIESQKCRYFVPAIGEKSAGTASPRIGDNESHVEIVGDGGKLPDEAGFGEIERDDSMFYTIFLAEFGSGFL